jgi:lipocalin
MKRATALALLAAILAAALAAPADAFLFELFGAKFGTAAAAAAKPAAAAAAPVAVAAKKPVAAAPRPMMMAITKPAVVPATQTKPAVLPTGPMTTQTKPQVLPTGPARPEPAVGTAAASSSSRCPPDGFDSAANLDLSKYIEKRWYTLAQRPVSYQPPDSLFCVSALYTPLDAAKGPAGGVTVRNYSNRGGVNGGQLGTSGAGEGTAGAEQRGPPAEVLAMLAAQAAAGGAGAGGGAGGPPAGVAMPTLTRPAAGPGGAGTAEPYEMIALPYPAGGANSSDPATAASKLIVGPKAFLQAAPLPVLARTIGANYRVVAFDEDGYEWAIVVSGTPDVEGEDGLCKFGGDAGFWLFSRAPVPSEETRAAIEEAAVEIGLDTSDLTEVPQEGCKYEGAR